MQCPYCLINFHDEWGAEQLKKNGSLIPWACRSTRCPACQKYIFELSPMGRGGVPEWLRVFPKGSARKPAPQEVPANIAEDYTEACLVLSDSPKASAALARRCLQTMLHQAGYRDRDLAREIDLLLNEADPKKAIPARLRDTIDGVRNFGNFSAHPITDVTSLQVIPVEPHEAEWCLEILGEMFEHFYVGPAATAAKKAALNAKLQAAGKPPAK